LEQLESEKLELKGLQDSLRFMRKLALDAKNVSAYASNELLKQLDTRKDMMLAAAQIKSNAILEQAAAIEEAHEVPIGEESNEPDSSEGSNEPDNIKGSPEVIRV
jgi:hypothetical protein